MGFWTSSVFSGLRPSGLVEAYVSDEGRKLAGSFAQLHSCSVAFERGSQSTGEHVRLTLVLPDDVLVVSAGASITSSAEQLCELAARAFDRAFVALTRRFGVAAH